jgi:Icc-related predicted phosphoesterase
MRILLVSDLHYTLKQLDWVTAAASDFDLVVVAGDHLNIASPVAPDAQIAVVLEYFARMAACSTVVACSGNHDLNARNALGERAAMWLADARRSGVLERDAERAGGRLWVWVYHAPPDASPTSWTGRRHYGDEALRQWIERHRAGVVLCGHVHESPFKTDGSWIDRIGSTVVFNAGRQRGPVPARVERHPDRFRGVVLARRHRGGDPRGRLVLGIGIALRTRLTARARRSHQPAEDDVDHLQTVFVLGVLLPEVGEIRRHHVQTGGQHARHRQRDARIGLEQCRRIVDDRDDSRFRRDDVSGARGRRGAGTSRRCTRPHR